jgi:hypothetical protein
MLTRIQNTAACTQVVRQWLGLVSHFHVSHECKIAQMWCCWITTISRLGLSEAVELLY